MRTTGCGAIAFVSCSISSSAVDGDVVSVLEKGEAVDDDGNG